MKKSHLLTLLGCALATTRVMAANYDLYVTGSTAFRPNVFAACSKIFDGGNFASSVNSAGGGTNATSGDNNWAMSGPCAVAGIVSPDTLTIHGLFTGSVQGQHAILNNDLLGFVGSATSSTIQSNYASIAFSDVFSKPTIFPLSSGFIEQPVAVQPFVFVKSTATVGVAKITNVTFQQIQSMIVPGTAPLSYFTGKSGRHERYLFVAPLIGFRHACDHHSGNQIQRRRQNSLLGRHRTHLHQCRDARPGDLWPRLCWWSGCQDRFARR